MKGTARFTGPLGASHSPLSLESCGERAGARTQDQRLKRAMLYQLSYPLAPSKPSIGLHRFAARNCVSELGKARASSVTKRAVLCLPRLPGVTSVALSFLPAERSLETCWVSHGVLGFSVCHRAITRAKSRGPSTRVLRLSMKYPGPTSRRVLPGPCEVRQNPQGKHRRCSRRRRRPQ